MPKTREDIKNDLKDAGAGSKSYEQMLDRMVQYIIRNYKLKRITITTTIKTESINKD